MDNLTELGGIWQNFQPKKNQDSKLKTIDESTLFKLRKIEKKHFKINLIKTIIVGILMSFMGISILSITNISFLIKIALAWIILSLITGMIVYWRKQYYSSQFNFIEDSSKFIKSTILKLHSQKQIITHLLPIMVTSMVIGINLIYFDLLKEESIVFRITSHLTVTILLYGVMYLGLMVRKRRFKKDFKPLIEELEMIYQNLKKD